MSVRGQGRYPAIINEERTAARQFSALYSYGLKPLPDNRLKLITPNVQVALLPGQKRSAEVIRRVQEAYVAKSLGIVTQRLVGDGIDHLRK